MWLYLMRHGTAEMRAPSGRDADRALNGEGAEKVRAVARRARAAGVEPTLILSSPYVRALETARVVAQVFDYRDKIETSAALVPDASPEEAWAEIRAHRREAELFITSHQPLCSELAAFLLDAPALQVSYRKAALMCFDLDAAGARPRARLEWMLVAKLA